MDLRLEPVSDADLVPLYALHREALGEAVERTWGAWDDAVQEPYFREHWDPEVRRKVVSRGGLAGFVDIIDDGTEVHLANIELGAGFRGRGLGSQLIMALQELGRPVSLQVLKANPDARRLYERLSFEPSGETEWHIQMRWYPAIAERLMTAWLDGPDRADISNPIHSTEVATAYGFRGALVGGVTVYGWCVPVVLAGLGDAWLDDGWADVRLRRPVYPGDDLVIRLTEPSGGSYALTLANAEGERCIVANVGSGKAPWLNEIAAPARRRAEARPAGLPALTAATAPVGEDLRPMQHDATAAAMSEYAVAKLHEGDDERWHGPDARIHPAWITAQMTPLLHHSYDYGPAIHTRTQVQHLARADVGQRVTFAARFVESFERHGDQYAVLDGVMLAEDGRELSRLRHTTIFAVARRA